MHRVVNNSFPRGFLLENISTHLLVVVAVALVDDQRRVLMHQRRSDSMHGGLWEFPGGKVERGETAELAALREIEEELGVTLESNDLRPVGFASGTSEAGRPIVILLYMCRRWAGEPRCLVGQALNWTGITEIPGLAMPPLDYPLAKMLISFK